jgi:hypothetical protein
MFASNFIITDKSLKRLRGEDKPKQYAQSATMATGNTMENNLCSNCGPLMYRISGGFPDKRFFRIGTVDDFNLHETKLMPRREKFDKDRIFCFTGGVGVKQEHGNYYTE